MASLKKFNGSTWVDSKLRKLTTSTDTITALPAVLYPTGTTATVGLKGNTLQSSIPSPTSPVMPQGTGERTGNLAQWEKGGINTTNGADEAYRTAREGGTCEQMRSLYIPCSENTTYVLHTNHYPVQTFISYYDVNKIYISRSSETPQGENRIFTTPETARYMRAQLAHVIGGQVYPAIEENQQYAITLGSTPFPYEPYGYKIPISSASTTTPVYLGEVQTTRKIKKYEFTGTESITADLTYSRFSFILNNSLIVGVRKTPAFCTHWQVIDDGRSIADVPNNALYSDSGNSRWFIKTTDYTSADDFKSYLAAQYAAGTPVTVWYVLTNEETGIVNEPLRKIGDYADEVSGISIPTITGKDTVDVETTLKPSEVELTYIGWHNAQCKEWDDSDWQ